MFRPVSSVDPSVAALSSAWNSSRSPRRSAVRPFATHLAQPNPDVVLPFDLALSAQNQALRATRELARALLSIMPRQASTQDVAAAVRVLRALSAYDGRTGRAPTLDRLA